MAIGVRNLQWNNHNAERAYPLAADATRTDVTGAFRLPDSFLVGLYIPIHAGHSVDPAKFFIKTIGVFSTGFSIVVGYAGSDGNVAVASALIARASHTINQSYALGGLGDFSDTIGRLVICKLDDVDKQPAGQFEFNLAGGRLEVDCIRPIIRGVTSIQVVNGNDVSDKLYGDIELRAGANMRITPVMAAGEDPVLVFDAIEGEGLTTACVCEGEEVAPPIRRINGIPPTAAGDFTLLGGDCIEITAIGNGLQFKDTCSQPCCGCSELVVITEALEMFGSQATTIGNFLTSLEAQVSTMDSVVLGSRLSDRGCFQCDD